MGSRKCRHQYSRKGVKQIESHASPTYSKHDRIYTNTKTPGQTVKEIETPKVDESPGGGSAGCLESDPSPSATTCIYRVVLTRPNPYPSCLFSYYTFRYAYWSTLPPYKYLWLQWWWDSNGTRIAWHIVRTTLTLIHPGFPLCLYYVYCLSLDMSVVVNLRTFTASGTRMGLELLGGFELLGTVFVSTQLQAPPSTMSVPGHPQAGVLVDITSVREKVPSNSSWPRNPSPITHHLCEYTPIYHLRARSLGTDAVEGRKSSKYQRRWLDRNAKQFESHSSLTTFPTTCIYKVVI